MSTIPRSIHLSAEEAELNNGDRMTQQEFHRAYEKTSGFKAELIGGIVYVASPVGRKHGMLHMPLSTILFNYESRTPGVESGDNSTVILGDDAEPQPDLYVRIHEDCGGQSKIAADLIVGAPEFVIEIASSSRAIDLHAKRSDYTRHGVEEYLVACVKERQMRWFDLRTGNELSLGDDGICRVRSFPGLWLDSAAVFERNLPRLMVALEQGCATPEHTAFAARLLEARALRERPT